MFGNTNAPPAVTSSAVIYALRSMVSADIPLNQVTSSCCCHDQRSLSCCCLVQSVFLYVWSKLAASQSRCSGGQPSSRCAVSCSCSSGCATLARVSACLSYQWHLCEPSAGALQGCLRPVTIKIPQGSMLWPSPEAAVVGGNVLVSQRLTDVILKCFSAAAASQVRLPSCQQCAGAAGRMHKLHAGVAAPFKAVF